MIFCIRCGQPLGDSPACTTPECDGLPNFYREVSPPRGMPPAPFHRLHVGEAVLACSDESATLVHEPGEGHATCGPRLAVLRATFPPHEEHTILAGKTEIGAQRPATIIVDRPEVSLRHATIECLPDTDGRWRTSLLDHESTNGTFLNGQRIQAAALADGDRVRFADAEFEFRLVGMEVLRKARRR